jgi:hypothetical protein
MVSSDFATAPLRWYIGNSDPGTIKNSPNLWAWFPAGDGQGQQASVGQFEATGLNNYSVEMDNLANRIFVITRTPKHYLTNTGANISGEALLAMEAPHVKKCQKRQREFSSQWQDICAFMMQLDGVTVEPSNVSVIWDRVESVQPLTEMQIVQTATGAGIPLESALARAGWSKAEIDDIMKKKQAAQKMRLNAVRVPVTVDPNGQQVTGL